jgi:hypothetical protein
MGKWAVTQTTRMSLYATAQLGGPIGRLLNLLG